MSGHSIAGFLREDAIVVGLSGASREEAVGKLLDRTLSVYGIPPERRGDIYGEIMAREERSSTGIGYGVAVPHCFVPGVRNIAVGLGISQEGIHFKAWDDRPVHILFLVIAPPDMGIVKLHILAKIAKFAGDRSFRSDLLRCRNPREAIALIRSKEMAMDSAISRAAPRPGAHPST
ncbi:MAG: PTS sugar transporter subunit IIA [bacterium]